MIVDLPDFDSVNRLADLDPGRYLVMESTYHLAGASPCHAIFTEMVAPGTGRSVGADLQVLFQDGTMLFRDFAIARDGAWRDSYGAKAAALADLLPPELARFVLVRRRGILVDHDGFGGLTPTLGHGADNGP